MKHEDQLDMQGATPLESRYDACWFSIKVRPLWGPVSGQCMLNTNWKRLKEPIYDAPFLFQNGIAEVIYYGQKRKINEKGEVVE